MNSLTVRENVSLCKMLVIKDVVLAETVISGTAGAVTKFQLRMVRICPAADGALVTVTPLGLLLPLLAHCGFELDRLMTALMVGTPPAIGNLIGDIGPEKHKEV